MLRSTNLTHSLFPHRFPDPWVSLFRSTLAPDVPKGLEQFYRPFESSEDQLSSSVVTKASSPGIGVTVVRDPMRKTSPSDIGDSTEWPMEYGGTDGSSKIGCVLLKGEYLALPYKSAVACQILKALLKYPTHRGSNIPSEGFPPSLS